MKRPLLFKSLTIGGLMLLLLIPLVMIAGSIDERRSYSEKVVEDIARSSSYEQTVIGPILVIPYQKTEREWRSDEKQGAYTIEKIRNGNLYILPDNYQLEGDMKTEIRHRGIYSARLYQADTGISGKFVVPINYGIEKDLEDYRFSKPFVTMGISDIRGIQNSLNLMVDGEQIEVEPGSQLKIIGAGVHAKLAPLPREQPHELAFSLKLVLQGTEQLTIAPIGRETIIKLVSNWPHPSFTGDHLPIERTVDGGGFRAQWQTSYFSTNFAERFFNCAQSDHCDSYSQQAIGVRLIDPVNHYVKNDRAIKYAILFIGLTFVGFFLFEILKRLAIHPIQYGLVGLALAIFYLLLLSLSEHIGFGLAYLISAIACVGLIGFYVSHILRSAAHGVVFMAGLSLLYGLLYGLLSAEDYALLMGAIFVFAVLGAFMVLTRKLDWYAVNVYRADPLTQV